MAYAIDHPAPGTILLISGDRDFVYAVSTLRLRRYRMIVVASPQTHPSLHRQASLTYAWNGGKVGSMQKPTHFLSGEISSQTQCRLDQNTCFPLSLPSFSPSRAPPNTNVQQDASHDSPSNYTHITSALNESPAPSGLLLGTSEGDDHDVLERGSQGVTPSPTGSALASVTLCSNDQQQNQTGMSTETHGSVPVHKYAALPARAPVQAEPAAQLRAGAPGPRLSMGSSSADTSASRKSFRLVGQYPRQILGNLSRRDRVVVWRRRLARSAGNGSKESHFSDASIESTKGLVLAEQTSGIKHSFWRKCQTTLVSFLTLKSGTSTPSIASNMGLMPLTPSSNSVFVTASSPSPVSAAIISPSAASTSGSEEQTEAAVNESVSVSMSASPETTSDCHVEPACKATTSYHALAQSAAVLTTVSCLVVGRLSRSSIKDDVNGATVATIMCEPPTKASLPVNTHSPVTKDEQLSSSFNALFAIPDSAENVSPPQSQMVALSGLDLPPGPLNAAIATTEPGPSLLNSQSVETSSLTLSCSKFVALVDELRSQHSQGLTHPKFPVVAEGLVRRNPLAYKQAGITSGKAKFDKYARLAVQAGVVSIGGDRDKWISLNPAWRAAPTTGDTTPPATSEHANVPSSFGLLVQRLRRLESKNVSQPYRSLVAIDLVMQDKRVYKKAGVDNFDAYAALAVKAGVVKLGGEGSRAWISLRNT